MKFFVLLLGAGFAFGQTPTAIPQPPAAGAPPSAAAAAPPVSADTVVLTVGDRKITKAEFEKILGTLSEQQRAQMQTPAARKKLAESLAELLALSEQARAQKLDQSDVVKLRIQIQSNQVLAQAMVEEMSKPTDGDLLAYYNSHKGEYEQVKARHILIRYKGSSVPVKKDGKDLTEEEALAKAQEIRAKLLAGGDFAELAKAESDDTGNATRGGDLGTFSKGRMVPEFEKAAFAAEVGKVTEPVKTKFGYHLIIVDSRDTRPFAEVKPEIERKLKQDMAQKAVAELKAKVPVTYDSAYFGPAAPPAPPKLQTVK
jgi:parvulin-like peptidyl-prolyl isomerase